MAAAQKSALGDHVPIPHGRLEDSGRRTSRASARRLGATVSGSFARFRNSTSH